VRCLYEYLRVGGDSVLGQDMQYDIFGESAPMKHHSLIIQVRAFLMDQFPVTVAQYAEYLTQAGLPSDGRSCFNLLRDWHWTWQGETNCSTELYCNCTNAVNLPSPPEAQLNSPVTWLSLREAREYCNAQGKRLPEEWEWQYAAQGGNPSNVYPWGATFDSTRVPIPTRSRTPDPPVDVRLFAVNGSSAFGVSDLIGNAWEWTSEFTDPHHRRAAVRGGSRFIVDSSHWYFPGAEQGSLQLNAHGNYILQDDAIDRSGFIGFRCALDVQQDDDQVQ
jgi:iron(II)-dependent oxidoreductase